MLFPKGFVWGAATSSYQVEGAVKADGRGESIFDAWCRHPGNVHLDQSGAVTADHYNRLDEDLKLMKSMGLQAYRFSIAWSRIQPDGTGRVNEAGIRWYERLVDGLLAAGITPWVTLFHWDLPQALQQRGGWLNREMKGWFADYAQIVVDRLGDRVRHWITLNEPQVFIKFGHGDATLAPGFKLGLDQQVVAGHNALLAHGVGCQVIRARTKTPVQVGWAIVGRTDFPASASAEDIAAARAGTLGVRSRDLWNNSWWTEPAFHGQYPEDGLKLFGPACEPPVQPGDMELIKQPVDFLGLNIYDGRMVKAGPAGEPVVVPFPDGHPQTAFRWFITPAALRWGPRFLFERYRSPIVITENGLSNVDWLMSDGKVNDPQRIDYTTRYLKQLRQAIADGSDVRGYFHWSLMDNFEWAAGYRERFGLIYVDYSTGERTLKDSAHWYRTVIESHGGVLGPE